ncbi:MAG: peptidase E [Gemmatimonadaceae bacterium]|nr:peptidase E [Gemmatimonadaceae bacterium]
MHRRDFVSSTATLTAAALATPSLLSAEPVMTDSTAPRATKKILIAGGGFRTKFIAYMAQLTGKARPRVLFLPTASADSPDAILGFYQSCAPLNVEPFVQPMFIESLSQTQGFDEVIFSADAIVVSGGNTLNQQAIWKAQGVDVLLRQAWEKGIVLGGASAGSLCWFEEGTTDSRPKALSVVKCMGFLKGSHCPHYDAEAGRRPLYHKLIGSGEMKPGFACDNDAGIYFEDEQPKRIVGTRAEARVYHVTLENGKVVEHELKPEMI